MSAQSDQLVQDLNSLQEEVGSLELRKEVAKSEVDGLNRQRAKLYADLEERKKVHQTELDKRTKTLEQSELKHKEAMTKLAKDQSDFVLERRAYLEEKAAFNSDKNALMEKVKYAQERIRRLENFLKMVDAERGRI